MMVDAGDFQKAIELIKSSKKVLLTSHTRPDGDACGSLRAMQISLEAIGKETMPVFMSPIPDWYKFMFDDKQPDILGNDITKEQMHAGHFDECDLIIIVDTNSYVQLPQFGEWLKETDTQVLVIDHHVTGDGLGMLELIDTTAAAAGEIVYDLLSHAGWPITESIAEVLFIALATDSGWFKFSNADSRIYHNAAAMIEAGAKPNDIYKKLYQCYTPQRMRLMVRMLGSLELHFDDRLAMQVVLRKDFDETGATGADTENMIDECQRIESVEVAALLVELADGGFRCSIRSKGHVDVRQVAQRYGGGGHTMAAGVNLPGPLEKAKKMVLDTVAEQLD
jgi:phosphoesterase RecJ-like protein